jgi:hypothetical protein
MNTFNMTCEAVEATLPDYLDETLETWVRSSVEEHLGQCLRCAGLVRDLRNIEREAGLLPDLVPVRDLWPGIESRIGTPVTAFVAPAISETPLTPVNEIPSISPSSEIAPVVPAGDNTASERESGIRPITDARSSRRRFFPAWIGAAAAALVVLTAGTTYLLTSRAVRSRVPQTAVVTPTPTRDAAPVVVTASIDDDSTHAARVDDSIRAGSRQPSRTEPRSRAPIVGRAPSTFASQSAAEAVYDKEIVMLQSIMRWRKADLDPATAAIIDKNLKIIDAAIAQSRAALKRDPASSMITDQLTHALDKKVELLRTAAMLPAST